MCVWSDVFILLFKCISVSVPPSYDVGWWKNWARLTNGGKKQRLGCVGVSNLALSTPPPNPPVNHRGRPTSDLLCLSGILIGSPAAHVDCSFTVRLSLWHTHRNTHTHNKHTLLPVCVWFYDRSSEDFLGLFLCFLFFFVFALLCTAWTIRVIVTKSLPEKILRKNHHNLTFLLVFQMQKECFSLPAIKATMTLFLYTNGAKKKYIYI